MDNTQLFKYQYSPLVFLAKNELNIKIFYKNYIFGNKNLFNGTFLPFFKNFVKCLFWSMIFYRIFPYNENIGTLIIVCWMFWCSCWSKDNGDMDTYDHDDENVYNADQNNMVTVVIPLHIHQRDLALLVGVHFQGDLKWMFQHPWPITCICLKINVVK